MNGIRAVAVLRAALRSMALFLALTLVPTGGFLRSPGEMSRPPIAGEAFVVRAAAFGIALLLLLGPVLELAAVRRRGLAFRLALAAVWSLAPMLAASLLFADGDGPQSIAEQLGWWLRNPLAFGGGLAPFALGAMLFAWLLGRRGGASVEPQRPGIPPDRSGGLR